VIEVRDLSVRYGSQTALSDASFDVAAGEFLLLTGASGSGKSTLARCLTGLIPHSSTSQSVRMTGSVHIDGRSTSDCTLSELASSIGLVFQNPSTQLLCLTVTEEVSFGPRNLGLSSDEVERRAKASLTAVGVAHLADRRITTLSGGEQQRVAIAAVLSMQPSVLILDEPTSNLDLKGARMVLDTLKNLHREQGLTIVVIEHRLQDLAGLADRALVLDQGRIVFDDTPSSLLDGKSLLNELGIRYPWHFLQDNWAAMLPEGLTASERAPVESPLVQLQDVHAGYERADVLKGVSLSIGSGEFLALVGDNGSGKTTLAKVMAGVLKPRKGKLLWNSRPSKARHGYGVGLLLQDPLAQLFCDSVEDEVSFGPRNIDQFSAESLEEVLSATDLTALRLRRPFALSSGQQQRTALAAVLSMSPRLLLLDEPTMGQDWKHLSGFMDFLVQLNGRGIAILLITHDHKLICHYARRILVLEEGRIVADGAPRLPVSARKRREWRRTLLVGDQSGETMRPSI